MTTKYIKVKDTEGNEVEARLVYRPFGGGVPFVDITYVRDDIRDLKPALDSNTLRQLAEELDAAVKEDNETVNVPETNSFGSKTLTVGEHNGEGSVIVTTLSNELHFGHKQLQATINGFIKLKKVLDAEV